MSLGPRQKCWVKSRFISNGVARDSYRIPPSLRLPIGEMELSMLVMVVLRIMGNTVLECPSRRLSRCGDVPRVLVLSAFHVHRVFCRPQSRPVFTLLTPGPPISHSNASPGSFSRSPRLNQMHLPPLPCQPVPAFRQRSSCLRLLVGQDSPLRAHAGRGCALPARMCQVQVHQQSLRAVPILKGRKPGTNPNAHQQLSG